MKIDTTSREVVKRFGGKGDEPGKFEMGYKMSIAGDRVYITDPQRKKVVVYRTDGTFDFDFKIPTPEEKEILDPIFPHIRTQGINPVGIAVDARKGIVYVSDVNFNTIHKLDTKGKLLGHIGHFGPAEEDLASPSELTVDSSGSLYVSEPTSHRVKVYDPDSGKLLRVIGKQSSGFIGGFIGIFGMNVDPSGNVVICDSGVHSIQVFDGKTGKYLYHIGNEQGIPDPEMKERALLGFTYAVEANVDAKGQMFIYRGDRKAIHVRQLEK
jgi:DNA-binding beta-propeller fold protein YncE